MFSLKFRKYLTKQYFFPSSVFSSYSVKQGAIAGTYSSLKHFGKKIQPLEEGMKQAERRRKKTFPQPKATHFPRGKYLIWEEEACLDSKTSLIYRIVSIWNIPILKNRILNFRQGTSKPSYKKKHNFWRSEKALKQKKLEQISKSYLLAIMMLSWFLLQSSLRIIFFPPVLGCYLVLSSNKLDYWDEFGSRCHRDMTVSQWSTLQPKRN